MASDWLEDFVAYSSYGEASTRLAYWVGVSTVAGALRRKVFIDEQIFQWSPNFYILVVGEPGTVRKSTSIDLGMELLAQVDGVHMGPNSATWQALIERIGQVREDYWMPDGEQFEMSCVTMGVSEFGSFFDPSNRELVDTLTDLWDGKKRFDKITKTSGNDTLIKPWINLIAATTPVWLGQNFADGLVGGGLASRFIYLYEHMPSRDIAYPSRQMPPRQLVEKMQRGLLDNLTNISKYGGKYELSEEAYEWGEQWYREEREKLRAMGSGTLESGFVVRKQVHLHKLAMVISAARYQFPRITLDHLMEANTRLSALDADTRHVFGYVGQNKITQAAREIAETVARLGKIERRKLYQRRFFRTMTVGEYNEAVLSAIQAELIFEVPDVAEPWLAKRP